MGKRAADETIGALIVALMKQRTWEQAALAREIGVSVDTVRRCLRRLQERDRSITCTSEPPHAVWRVPRGWAPGALPLGANEARALFYLLARAPGKMRNELLGRVVALLPEAGAAARAASVVVVNELTEGEERAYAVFVEAAVQRKAVRMRYRSLRGGGEAEARDVSPHRILAGAVPYVLGTCHREGKLKLFRLSAVDEARIAATVPYRDESHGEIERWLATSAQGFRAERAETIEFDVRRSAWAGVSRNLPKRVTEEALTWRGDWIRVRVETAAVQQWAKHLVGLGVDVRVHGVLREAVREVVARASEALEAQTETAE
jgi:predicted DNA-binding transcriptional regulator YafY